MPKLCWVNAGIACFALLLVGIGSGITAADAQSSTSPVRLIPRIKEDRNQQQQASRRISLVVQVTDAAGKPLSGLKANDFTVLDNRKPQTIPAFREVDGQAFKADLHVMVVLDAVNDGGSGIGHLKKDFGKYLSEGKGPLPFPLSLVYISDAGAAESKPTTDRGVIAGQLAQLARNSHSSNCDDRFSSIEGSRISQQPGGAIGSRANDHASCVNARLVQSIEALRSILGEQQNVAGRGILVWAGPGWPMVADYGAGPGPEQPRGNYRDVLVELATNLRVAQLTLDAVSWEDFEHPKNSRQPIVTTDASVPSTPDQLAEESMALPALARLSGGQAFSRIKNFSDAFATLVADADRFYVLSFDSLPSKAPDEFRSIEVKVNRPDVTVRTSTGYYAQP